MIICNNLLSDNISSILKRNCLSAMSVGLGNLGATCYMNSALQCICRIPVIAEYFKTNSYRTTVSKYGVNKNSQSLQGFLEQFSALTKALHDTEDTRAIRPLSFRKYFCVFHPQFRGAQQQDAHEMLLALLETLHDSLKIKVSINITGTVKNGVDERKMKAFDQYKKHLAVNGYSELNKWFGGQYESTVKCLECNQEFCTYDPFDCLSIEIPEGGSTLYDCLDAFVSTSELIKDEDNDNTYNCDKCKKRVNAKKNIKIWKTPDVLIIQLKRFNTHIKKMGNRYFAQTSKNNNFIKYPMELDMTKYNPEVLIECNKTGEPVKPILYDLMGVVEHSGALRGGHYTAKCRANTQTQEWQFYNDASVLPINRNIEEEVVNTRGYLLFYTRK